LKEGFLLNMKAVKDFIYELFVSAAIVAFIYFFIAVFPLVPTASMNPTIVPGERVVVEKLTRFFRTLEYGDILVFPCPDSKPGAFPYIKRLIAKGGDVLEFVDGKVYRNGDLLEEPYAVGQTYSYQPRYEIPEGMLFFMGDNRSNSEDARFWHTTSFVSEKAVIGRAVAIMWPLNQLRVLK